ncbi:MAG: CBS domain-containing protein [Pseudomonadaceae bacterium]|nr:CBS domain-containing protein [Pseudomonadaceae bacterium]
MSTRLVTFQADTNVVSAMAVLLKEKISGAPVVDEVGNLVGVLSEVDIMQVIVQDSYYDESVGIVGDFMHSPAEVVSPDTDIYTLAERFIKEGRRRYPVVSNGRLVGQISRRDVLRAAEEMLQHKK